MSVAQTSNGDQVDTDTKETHVMSTTSRYDSVVSEYVTVKVFGIAVPLAHGNYDVRIRRSTWGTGFSIVGRTQVIVNAYLDGIYPKDVEFEFDTELSRVTVKGLDNHNRCLIEFLSLIHI